MEHSHDPKQLEHATPARESVPEAEALAPSTAASPAPESPAPAPSADEDVRATRELEITPLPDLPPTPKRRVPVLPTVLAVAAVLVLLGGGVWWVLGRGEGGPSSTPGRGTPVQGGLPDDTVALINSSTPIEVRMTTGTSRASFTLDTPPQEEGWSPPVREASRALTEGRHTSAISQFSALVGSGDGAERRDALWGLARAYEASGQRELALRAYSLFAGLDDPRASIAFYRVALLYEASARDSEAAQLFGEYAAAGGPAKHAAMLRQARLLGPVPEAEEVYKDVLRDNPMPVDNREALAGLADLYARRGNNTTARDTYDALAVLQRADTRPVLDQETVPAAVRAADEARLAGDSAGARQRALNYIGDSCTQEAPPCRYYPFGRHLAIESLLKVDANAVVSGTVAPMLAARTAYDAGYYGRAVAHLDTVRAQQGDPNVRAEASLMTGLAYQASGSPSLAYNWYTDTVRTFPQSPLAPEAIRRAGDMLVRQSAWDQAALVYVDALARYPNAGEETFRTRLNGGVLAYRLEKPDDAIALLGPLVAGAPPTSTVRAEGAFWLAKIEKSRGNSAWQNTMRPITSTLGGTYLGFRARSLLGGEPDGGPLIPTFTQSGITEEDLTVSYARENADRVEFLRWAGTFRPIAVATPSTGLTGTSTVTGTVTVTATRGVSATNLLAETERALALNELGDNRATLALRALAERLAEEGRWVDLARLVTYSRYRVDPSTSMRVAERFTLHYRGDTMGLPRLLLRTLYPAPFASLAVGEARVQEIDPLVMYALMRQESRFVPGARSRADARGLTQVIPSTGAEIARQLGDGGYTLESLFLPHVSIRYGTYYIASNMTQFDRKLIPSYAAYNGGPGNAARWLDGSALRDPDLYLERVDFFETREYLRIVYTNYGFYRLAYGP
jgi:soluble lytic murein transglycosylase